MKKFIRSYAKESACVDAPCMCIISPTSTLRLHGDWHLAVPRRVAHFPRVFFAVGVVDGLEDIK